MNLPMILRAIAVGCEAAAVYLGGTEDTSTSPDVTVPTPPTSSDPAQPGAPDVPPPPAAKQPGDTAPPPPPPPPADAGGGEEREFDSAGVAWHKDWHSQGKTQNKDGTWKLKKGTDRAAYKEWVERCGDMVPEANAGAVPPPPTTPPPPPPAEPPAAAPPAAEELTWPTVLQRITAANSAGTYNQDAVGQLFEANGIEQFNYAATRPDLWPEMLRLGNA